MRNLIYILAILCNTTILKKKKKLILQITSKYTIRTTSYFIQRWTAAIYMYNDIRALLLILDFIDTHIQENLKQIDCTLKGSTEGDRENIPLPLSPVLSISSKNLFTRIHTIIAPTSLSENFIHLQCYFIASVCLRWRMRWLPTSCTSGHCFNTNTMPSTTNVVVNIRTLHMKQ
ncbi:hypothetical protein PUN28_007204 [Cardiocondyla obscurior]|uniref:Uncharacterized protein n=1 Tax=Cardiocondyla obscurior TaxID=286306 RepID=A0AAW2G3Y1_9HYME